MLENPSAISARNIFLFLVLAFILILLVSSVWTSVKQAQTTTLSCMCAFSVFWAYLTCVNIPLVCLLLCLFLSHNSEPGLSVKRKWNKSRNMNILWLNQQCVNNHVRTDWWQCKTNFRVMQHCLNNHVLTPLLEQNWLMTAQNKLKTDATLSE